MKKIKSIKHLKEEKKRLHRRQAELEQKISGQWSALRSSLRPATLARDAYNKMMDDKAEENYNNGSILKSTLNYGISLLTKKFTEKAGEKLGKLFSKKKGGKKNDN